VTSSRAVIGVPMSAGKLRKNLTNFFCALTGLDLSDPIHVLVLLLFASVMFSFWPFIHWQLWAMKTEVYHVIFYCSSFIILGVLVSGKILDKRSQGWNGRILTTHWKIVLTVLCATHLSIAVLLSLLFLGKIPHQSDGVWYLFQAKIFATGALSLPVPKYGQFLAMDHVLMHNAVAGSRFIRRDGPRY
jgi:hypothetical protein